MNEAPVSDEAINYALGEWIGQRTPGIEIALYDPGAVDLPWVAAIEELGLRAEGFTPAYATDAVIAKLLLFVERHLLAGTPLPPRVATVPHPTRDG